MIDWRNDSHSSGKWKVFRLDTFEADSRADEAGAGWYEINEFQSEEAAVKAVWEILRKPQQKSEIVDHVVLVDPEGKANRCVLPPCTQCSSLDSMIATGKEKKNWKRRAQGGLAAGFCFWFMV